MPPPNIIPGRVLGIARREVKRGPMLPLERVEVSLAAGVTGDTRGRPGPRQVTVLSAGAWLVACAIAGTDLPWLARRANILVDGLDLRQAPPGDPRLHVRERHAMCIEVGPTLGRDLQQPGLRGVRDRTARPLGARLGLSHVRHRA